MENQESPHPDTIPAPPRETIRYVGDVGELFTALAKAQAEFVEMDRDAQVKFDNRMFKYATLAEVLASVRPALNKYGLALLQPFDGDKVTTILALGSTRIEVDVLLPNWANVQALGSALTYVKRYQLKSMLGVNDGEDDDGLTASGSDKKAEPRPRATPPEVKPSASQAPGYEGPSDAIKATIKGLASGIGFKGSELNEFSIKHGCGPLDKLNQAKAEVLAKLLDAQANPGVTQ
jgi:hypothetical protein